MKYWIRTAVGAVVIACAASACGTENSAAVNADGSVDLSKVTLRVGDQKGGSEALLTASGELTDAPYKVEFKPFTSGPPLLDAVSSAAVDLGGVGNTPPLFAIDQDKKIKIVHAAEQGSKSDSIVVRDDSPIRSVKQLKGKKVAVAKGSSANYNLLAQLEKVGLSFDDIEPVWVQPSEGLAAFTGKHVDAWAIWDPFTAQAELEADARIIASGESVTNGVAFQVASDKALDDKATKAAIADYLSRISRAQEWANSNKKSWAKTWAEETGLSTEITEQAIQRRFYVPLKVTSTLESEQKMWDAFVEQDQLSRDVELGEYFDDSFDDSVDPDKESQ